MHAIGVGSRCPATAPAHNGMVITSLSLQARAGPLASSYVGGSRRHNASTTSSHKRKSAKCAIIIRTSSPGRFGCNTLSRTARRS